MAKKTTKKIDAKEAAQLAVRYYQDVTNDFNQPSIAEIELTEDASVWLITLAHRAPSSSPFAAMEDKLSFKAFEVSAYTGEVLSMKIKKV